MQREERGRGERKKRGVGEERGESACYACNTDRCRVHTHSEEADEAQLRSETLSAGKAWQCKPQCMRVLPADLQHPPSTQDTTHSLLPSCWKEAMSDARE
jgi:hypothetical protein